MNQSRILSWEGSLIQRAATGDSNAFRLLSSQHRPALQRLAARMLRDPSAIEDAVQETLCKAWRVLPGFEPTRPLKPWLLRICRNCCLDVIRERSSVPIEGIEDGLVESSASPFELAERSEQRRAIESALETLPADYRQVVRMRHFEDLDILEIAAKLRRPEGTIKSWLHRARALLAQTLRPAL